MEFGGGLILTAFFVPIPKRVAGGIVGMPAQPKCVPPTQRKMDIHPDLAGCLIRELFRHLPVVQEQFCATNILQRMPAWKALLEHHDYSSLVMAAAEAQQPLHKETIRHRTQSRTEESPRQTDLPIRHVWPDPGEMAFLETPGGGPVLVNYDEGQPVPTYLCQNCGKSYRVCSSTVMPRDLQKTYCSSHCYQEAVKRGVRGERVNPIPGGLIPLGEPQSEAGSQPSVPEVGDSARNPEQLAEMTNAELVEVALAAEDGAVRLAAMQKLWHHQERGRLYRGLYNVVERLRGLAISQMTKHEFNQRWARLVKEDMH